MKNLIRDNQCLAKSFNYTVRYIDDLLTFNNAKFETEITNIYPSELTLKRTTESATLLSYLDMTVYINHDRFSTTLYDKRDSFSFDIVNFPHMSSNIPSKPAYGVYISQLIRIGEDFSAFAERHYKLTSRLTLSWAEVYLGIPRHILIPNCACTYMQTCVQEELKLCTS